MSLIIYYRILLLCFASWLWFICIESRFIYSAMSYIISRSARIKRALLYVHIFKIIYRMKSALQL